MSREELRGLVAAYVLGTLDAIHLTSALIWSKRTFPLAP